MDYKDFKYEDVGGVRKITISRSNPLNPVTQDVLEEIKDALESSGGKGIFRLGANKAFSAGADIKGFHDLDSRTAYSFALRGHDIMNFFASYERPIIAAMHGYALGGGFELALACDIRIAHPGTVLGLPEITLGIIPGFGGTQRLTRLVGEARAIDMIGRGLRIDADEALHLGVLNYVADDYLGKAMEIAVDFSKKPKQSLKFVKNLVRAEPDDRYALEAEDFGKTFDHPDRKEGVAAFLEKRSPKFSD